MSTFHKIFDNVTNITTNVVSEAIELIQDPSGYDLTPGSKSVVCTSGKVTICWSIEMLGAYYIYPEIEFSPDGETWMKAYTNHPQQLILGGGQEEETLNSVTQANPGVFQSASSSVKPHYLIPGDKIVFQNAAGMTEINSKLFYVKTVPEAHKFTVSLTEGGTEYDTSNFSAYTTLSAEWKNPRVESNSSRYEFITHVAQQIGATFSHAGVLTNQFNSFIPFIPPQHGSTQFDLFGSFVRVTLASASTTAATVNMWVGGS